MKNKIKCYYCHEEFNEGEISYPEEGSHKHIALCQVCLTLLMQGQIALDLK